MIWLTSPRYHFRAITSARRSPRTLRMTIRSWLLAPPGPTTASTFTGKASAGSLVALGCSRAIFWRFSASVKRFWSILVPRTSLSTSSLPGAPEPPEAARASSLTNQTPSLRPPLNPFISSMTAPGPMPSKDSSCPLMERSEGSKDRAVMCNSPASSAAAPAPGDLRGCCGAATAAALLAPGSFSPRALPSTPVPMKRHAGALRSSGGDACTVRTTEDAVLRPAHSVGSGCGAAPCAPRSRAAASAAAGPLLDCGDSADAIWAGWWTTPSTFGLLPACRGEDGPGQCGREGGGRSSWGAAGATVHSTGRRSFILRALAPLLTSRS
mmetsp:Transcript_42556/g.112985  ORF Transcript_42556/g.112985 Transcript_42556/m.112985 type:complete len:325 (+) Transcript_42556:330-1304(+)